MTYTPILKTGNCPKCGVKVDFELCEMFSKIVPICDDCAENHKQNWAAEQKQKRWQNNYTGKMSCAYADSMVDKINFTYKSIMVWTALKSHGGCGLIGDSGEGKSCAMACLIRKLERPFLWWSGTEARDAAIDAACADQDRAGAQRVWQSAMRVPILILDDISQSVFTQAWSSKLFDLLETRIGAGLPTMWTSQISVVDLGNKIIRQNGGDVSQSQAITRRLAYNSLILK